MMDNYLIFILLSLKSLGNPKWMRAENEIKTISNLVDFFYLLPKSIKLVVYGNLLFASFSSTSSLIS